MAKRRRTEQKGPPERNPIAAVSITAPNEDNRWPVAKLAGEALRAFCETRIPIRRAQICRAFLRKYLALPVGYHNWEHEQPRLERAQQAIELVRPVFVLLSPLRQKERYASIESECYHDRAIREATPLIEALAAIKQDGWGKLGVRDRWDLAWGLPEIDDYFMTETCLSFAFMEAEKASTWLRELSPKDFRILVSGSYACRRLDAIADQRQLDEKTHEERLIHIGTLMSVSNDLGKPTLAKEIQTAMGNPAGFVYSAIYDEFKGHLIDANNRIIPPNDFSKSIHLSTDMMLPGSKLLGSFADVPPRPPSDVDRADPQADDHGQVDTKSKILSALDRLSARQRAVYDMLPPFAANSGLVAKEIMKKLDQSHRCVESTLRKHVLGPMKKARLISNTPAVGGYHRAQ